MMIIAKTHSLLAQLCAKPEGRENEEIGTHKIQR